MCQCNIPKGQRVDTTVKQVRDLLLEKSVYTNLNQLYWQRQKRIIGLCSNCDKSRELKNHRKTWK